MRLDKVKDQQEYKHILDTQMQTKAIPNELSIGEHKRITNAVHKMESADHGMVPGIYNLASVGSKPIYRTGLMITKSYTNAL